MKIRFKNIYRFYIYLKKLFKKPFFLKLKNRLLDEIEKNGANFGKNLIESASFISDEKRARHKINLNKNKYNLEKIKTMKNELLNQKSELNTKVENMSYFNVPDFDFICNQKLIIDDKFIGEIKKVFNSIYFNLQIKNLKK